MRHQDGDYIWRKTIGEGREGDFWAHRTGLFLDLGSGYVDEFKFVEIHLIAHLGCILSV